MGFKIGVQLLTLAAQLSYLLEHHATVGSIGNQLQIGGELVSSPFVFMSLDINTAQISVGPTHFIAIDVNGDSQFLLRFIELLLNRERHTQI